jgi:hypothetical protein
MACMPSTCFRLSPRNRAASASLGKSARGSPRCVAGSRTPGSQASSALYTAREVVEQRGTHPLRLRGRADAAEAFYARLRELFAEKKCITTFGPYSPGQAVAMKRMGIEGIYLGGWATSAKGSAHEDPGPDLASYPLSPGARRGRADRARAAHGGPRTSSTRARA